MDDTGRAGDAVSGANGEEAGSRSGRSWSGGGWAPGDVGWSAPDADAKQPAWHEPSAVREQPFARAWTDPSSRYADALTPQPAAAPATRHSNGVSHDDGELGAPRHGRRPDREVSHNDGAPAHFSDGAAPPFPSARHRRDPELAEPGHDGPGSSAGYPSELGSVRGSNPVIPAPRSGSSGAGPAEEAAAGPEQEPWAQEPAPPPRYPDPPSPAPTEQGVETSATRTASSLPQRVPAEPDVPKVPELPAAEPSAETPELARIATHLRRRDDPPKPPHERPDGFDVDAIVAAVRGVEGVRDASVRTTPDGAHRLRLDLADGADPAEVSRTVARLLQERMGLAAAPQNLPADRPVVPRRRRRLAERQGTDAAGEHARAAADESGGSASAEGAASVRPDTPRAGGQAPTGDTRLSRPLDPGDRPGPRVVIEHVQVSTFGMEATVEVRLAAGEQRATGLATGPAVDGYVVRLGAVAAASAIDGLLRTAGRSASPGRCFVEHATVVPLGNCEVAVVVVLLVCDGWVEQLAGSAVVAGDPRQAVVRATLAAVNRRLSALLA